MLSAFETFSWLANRMARTIMVHFVSLQHEESTLIHRIRNFGEDVFRRVRDDDWGTVTIDEVDIATTHFAVTDVKASKLRRVVRWIEEEAARQHLQISVEVT